MKPRAVRRARPSGARRTGGARSEVWRVCGRVFGEKNPHRGGGGGGRERDRRKGLRESRSLRRVGGKGSSEQATRNTKQRPSDRRERGRRAGAEEGDGFEKEERPPAVYSNRA